MNIITSKRGIDKTARRIVKLEKRRHSAKDKDRWDVVNGDELAGAYIEHQILCENLVSELERLGYIAPQN